MGINNSLTDVLNQANTWHKDGHDVELVTVVNTFGSSPRPVGSMAAVRHDGLLVGSVSGGCIEKQLVERMRSGEHSHSTAYRISDEEAKRHGLLCGGQIELVFETLTPLSQLEELQTRMANKVRTRRTLNLATGEVQLTDAAREDKFEYQDNTVVNVIGPNYHLLIIGANELARFTAEFAIAVDFSVTVAEPRKEFLASWPSSQVAALDSMPDDAVKELSHHEHCGVLALTHDPNLDDLALMEALERDLFYVGALGSKRSHEKRLHRLRGFDITEDKLSLIQAPIGLSIGSRTSAEIAISIVAELIQHRAD